MNIVDKTCSILTHEIQKVEKQYERIFKLLELLQALTYNEDEQKFRILLIQCQIEYMNLLNQIGKTLNKNIWVV